MNKPAQRTWRKPVISAAIGALFGFGAMMGFLNLGGEVSASWSGGRIALSGVGFVYLLTGLFVGFGILAPSLGARVLNVGDAEELREQRAILSGSALSMGAFGAMLLLLAAAGAGGFVADWVAIAAMLASIAINIAIYLRQWRLYDELWRQLSWEGSAFAMHLLLPALILWAGLAHLGHLPAIDPLGVVALAAAAVLLGAFMAAGRRGLLAQR
ncbi:hypothetical protein D1610_04795 [Sphingomonas gilva]|uniref:Uncharacterized protein n=1 Tax=Sphingomonas gilva TaxID=2305907 RepID=A0A396RRB4_9SPHN|nr:hypothetical protein [Sphingomonas gilva]RHW17842.1 hypothetical protein D1610_04795 [Sphingomonas gilva]